MTKVVDEQDARVTLPPRYRTRWRAAFEQAVHKRLVAGATVLDIGSGRNPSVAPELRPLGVEWVGLDCSRVELERAAPGAYDDLVVADVATRVPPLAGRVDLAVSWQVLEHVRPLDAAIANVHAYLKPGGAFVSVFSGSWSAFAVVNRAIPDRLGEAIVGRTMRRRGSDHPVFPAHYDRCYASALEPLFADWAAATIEPLYRGATYFHFSRTLQRAYLAYEGAVMRRRLANLATHYFLVATR